MIGKIVTDFLKRAVYCLVVVLANFVRILVDQVWNRSIRKYSLAAKESLSRRTYDGLGVLGAGGRQAELAKMLLGLARECIKSRFGRLQIFSSVKSTSLLFVHLPTIM